MLKKIAPLCQIEKELREAKADLKQIERTRQDQNLPILEDPQHTLHEIRRRHVPKSPVGKAYEYALGLWDRAKVYC